MEMDTQNMTHADPAIWLLQYVSWEVATKENKWQGRNIVRWRSAAYDTAYNAAMSEIDPVRRAVLLIKCNDLVVAENVLPLVHRAKTSAAGSKLVAPQSGWDNDLWSLPDWYKEA